MVRREGQSDFLDSLNVDVNGDIKITAKNCSILSGVFTKEQSVDILKKIARHDIISKDVMDTEVKRMQSGISSHHGFENISSEFDKIKSAGKIAVKTAKLFRQLGIFKVADRQVYQDFETGDFWKISEDGESVLRMFKEMEDGVADKVS